LLLVGGDVGPIYERFGQILVEAPSQKWPLKLSTWALSIGLPGASCSSQAAQ
jgi:hypothetical protein